MQAQKECNIVKNTQTQLKYIHVPGFHTGSSLGGGGGGTCWYLKVGACSRFFNFKTSETVIF